MPWLEDMCLRWLQVPGAGLPGKGLPVLSAHCVHFVMETSLERNHVGDAALEHLTLDALLIANGKLVSRCGCCSCCKGMTLPLSPESDHCHEDAPENNKRLQ